MFSAFNRAVKIKFRLMRMLESKISPFHGGIAIPELTRKFGTTTALEFYPNTSSVKNGLREELVKSFLDVKVESLSLEERLSLCLDIAEECIKPEELAPLLSRSGHLLISYDGFEPSGRMHIAQGFNKVHNVNTLAKVGVKSVLWIADWFAMLNNKLGGDLNDIRTVGEYFIHIWKAAGMDMSSVRFLWASDEINRNPDLYWRLVMDISKSFNITRMKRCSQALGRIEGDDQPAAQLLYPAMQCADIFYIGADICQLGMDQRKINMLAREYCEHKKLQYSPVILSHNMLPGLLQGQDKMSKSNPNSAIFMDDTEEDVKSKIKKAYCPPGITEGNPCLSYFTHIVFKQFTSVTINRKDKDGGDVVYNSPNEMTSAFVQGLLHPADLKAGLANYLNLMLRPIREYFESDEEAKQLLRRVKQIQAKLNK